MPRNTISKSGFRFVHQHTDGRYYTYVLHEGKRLHAGLFPSAFLAAEVHDSIAWHLLGERDPRKLSSAWSETTRPPVHSGPIAAFARMHGLEKAGRPADPFFDSGQGEDYLAIRSALKHAETARDAAQSAVERLSAIHTSALLALPPQYRALL